MASLGAIPRELKFSAVELKFPHSSFEFTGDFDVLINYLCNMPIDEQTQIRLIKGQGADTLWLRMYQNAINKQNPKDILGMCENSFSMSYEKGRVCLWQSYKSNKD